MNRKRNIRGNPAAYLAVGVTLAAAFAASQAFAQDNGNVKKYSKAIKPVLNQVVDCVKSNPDDKEEIGGYSDNWVTAYGRRYFASESKKAVGRQEYISAIDFDHQAKTFSATLTNEAYTKRFNSGISVRYFDTSSKGINNGNDNRFGKNDLVRVSFDDDIGAPHTFTMNSEGQILAATGFGERYRWNASQTKKVYDTCMDSLNMIIEECYKK